jgi:hypothetical protein
MTTIAVPVGYCALCGVLSPCNAVMMPKVVQTTIEGEQALRKHLMSLGGGVSAVA